MNNKNNKIAEMVESKEVISLSKDLIEIPSHIDSKHQEKNIALYLRDYLINLGCNVQLQEVEGGRSNIIAVLPGTGKGRSLMLNGHLDTVPPAGMKNPFTPRIDDGKLYGRGSTDMKGAIAAMVIAVKTIASSGVELKGDLIFTGTVGEETGSIGMNYLMNNGDLNPDFCLVGEPTSLNLGIAHKGIEWLKIEAQGKTAHGSTPELGINAIRHMNQIIRALENDLIPRLEKRSHHVLGSPTINIGTIEGGDKVNIVPERCKIKLDRRWIPGESVSSILEEVENVIDEIRREITELNASVSRMEEISNVWHGPFEIPKDHELVSTVDKATSRWSDHPKKIGLSYWTDGALAHKAGIPTLIFGPGDAKKAHTEDEFVLLNNLVHSARIYCQVASDIVL